MFVCLFYDWNMILRTIFSRKNINNNKKTHFYRFEHVPEMLKTEKLERAPCINFVCVHFLDPSKQGLIK